MSTDAELAVALAGGDAQALAGIYDRYGDHLHNFCHGVCRNADQAADATQQTFLLAFERIGQLRDPSRLKSWLFAIARNEVMKGFRDTSRTRPVDDEAILETATDADAVEATLETAELQGLVWEAAVGLDERDRLLLELNVRSGLEGAELADAVGVSVDHSYVLVKRMRERVEKSLGALLVARQARNMCDDLERLLSDWDGTFSIPVRKRVSRHLTQCDDCDQRRRKLVSPLALYGVAPVLAAPLGLRQAILESAGSWVETAHASEYNWGEDGFPEPLEDWYAVEQTNNADSPGEASSTHDTNNMASRFRNVRRFGLSVVVVGGLILAGVTVTQGSENQAILDSSSTLKPNGGGQEIITQVVPAPTDPPTTSVAPTTTVITPPTTTVVPTETTVPPATETTVAPEPTVPPTTEAPPETTTTTTTTTTTLPPVPTPNNFSIDPGGQAIWIAWAPPTPLPPGGYEVGIQDDGGPWVITAVQTPPQLTHGFHNLACGHLYTVGVRYVDDEGRTSEWVSGTAHIC